MERTIIIYLVCGFISLFPYQSEALFEDCTTNDNCTDSGAFCDVGGFCVCNLTSHYISNQVPNQTCEAKHGLDEVCPTSPAETCLDVNAECQTDGQDTRCRCKSGYINSGGQCVTVCPTLSDGTYFIVSVASNIDGGTATYTCITGYSVGDSSITTSTRTCTNGAWNGQEPNCTPVDCGPLSNPPHGTVGYIGTAYQSIAAYTCNTGYIVSGTVSDTTKVVVCTTTGLWSDTATCTIKADPLGATCPDPDSTNLSQGELCSANNASCLQRTSNSQDYTCQCNTGYYDDNGNQAAGLCRSISELTVQSIGFTSVTITSIRVTWTAPPNKASFISGYLVQWRRKDNQVGGSTSQELTNTNFDITNNVVSGTAYAVQVTSLNTVDYTDKVGSTFSQKEQALKPQKPGSINTVLSNLDAQDQRISLVWAPSPGTAALYDVRLYESGAQQALVNVTTFTYTTSLYYQQMKNGYRYDVSMIAVSQQYDGTKVQRSEERREQIKTVVKVPSAPRLVQCQGTTDSSVIIRWQSSLMPNGDLVGYKIDTYRLGSNDILTSENKAQNIGNVIQTYEVGGLGPGSNYYFNVFTLNEKYISSATRLTETSCQTRASMADAPNDLQVSNITGSNFSVSWTKPTNTFGEHQGYVVQVRLLDDTCVKQLLIKCTGCTGSFGEATLENMCEQSRSTTEQLSTQIISSTTPISRTFTELDPDVNYNVIVTVVNTEGRGRIANQTLRTDEEVPQRPKGVSISDLTATSCTVTWNIDGPRPGDTIYTVIIDAISPVTHDNLQLKGFDNRKQALTDLQEYWNYTVIIRAETSKGSVNSDPKTFITRAAAPGHVNNFNIILHPSNDRRITVEWKVPVLLERNSVIYRFVLYHNTTEDIDERVITFPKNVDDNYKYTQTFNVTPGDHYLFQVFAVNTDNQNGIATERTVMAPAFVIQDGTTSATSATSATSNIAVIVVAVIVPIIVIAAIVAVVLVIYRRRSAQQSNSSKSKEEVQTNKRNNRLVSGPVFSQRIMENQINIMEKSWKYHGILLKKPTEFTSNMTKKEVVEWLESNDFDGYRTQFKDYTGHDLLKLSKDDLKSICGAADGIRMFNRLRESTTDCITPQEDQAYMDLDDTKRDGVPYENIEMDRTHMYSSLQHV